MEAEMGKIDQVAEREWTMDNPRGWLKGEETSPFIFARSDVIMIL